MRNLEDKVVLITGASRGLGVDIAKEFAARGAKLALAARSQADLEQVRDALVAEGCKQAIAVPADVGDLDSLRNLVERVTADLDPVDVLVNNAGIEEVYEFEDTPPERIAKLIQVNVTGLLWLTRLVAPSMIARQSGHIVNIASLAGLVPVPHNAVYSATKHAVVGASHSLRIELGDHGIGVSVVCPGFVREVGMFAVSGKTPPALAGTITSADVARATLRAVRSNKAEIIVAPGLGKIADVFQAVSPGLSHSLLRWTGVVGFMRERARTEGLSSST